MLRLTGGNDSSGYVSGTLLPDPDENFDEEDIRGARSVKFEGDGDGKPIFDEGPRVRLPSKMENLPTQKRQTQPDEGQQHPDADHARSLRKCLA